MTKKLWVFGTLIVCAVLFGLMTSKSADAQGGSIGRWQITSGVGSQNTAWKIDTVTGESQSVGVLLIAQRPAFCSARGDKASMPCAASPPKTFCQDQVKTSHLS